jgi:hypothetical protein
MEYTYEIVSAKNIDSLKRIDKNGDVAWVPMDPANRDYQEYLKSLEEGSN